MTGAKLYINKQYIYIYMLLNLKFAVSKLKEIQLE